nr:hypothetical protein Ccrd_011493 [Ipomoea batatas]
MVWSAPRLLANDRRRSSTSAIRIVGAPKARAASMVTRPMGPAPRIKILVPGPMPARLHAWTPTLRGSHIAPSSKLTLSGLRTETAERRTTLLAVANRDGGSRRHSWWSRTEMANGDGSGRAVAAPGS